MYASSIWDTGMLRTPMSSSSVRLDCSAFRIPATSQAVTNPDQSNRWTYNHFTHRLTVFVSKFSLLTNWNETKPDFLCGMSRHHKSSNKEQFFDETCSLLPKSPVSCQMSSYSRIAKEIDTCVIRTHAPEGIALAGQRVNHSAKVPWLI
jgi:hypothetical protein